MYNSRIKKYRTRSDLLHFDSTPPAPSEPPQRSIPPPPPAPPLPPVIPPHVYPKQFRSNPHSELGSPLLVRSGITSNKGSRATTPKHLVTLKERPLPRVPQFESVYDLSKIRFEDQDIIEEVLNDEDRVRQTKIIIAQNIVKEYSTERKKLVKEEIEEKLLVSTKYKARLEALKETTKKRLKEIIHDNNKINSKLSEETT